MKNFIKPNLEVIESIGTDEQRAIWVKALRSRKYKQHRGSMTDPKDLSCACCLQVAAIEVDGMDPKDAIDNDFTSMSVPSDIISVINDLDFSIAAQEPNQIATSILKYDDFSETEACSFAELNDSWLTHDQIADIIEGKEVELD